MYLIYGQFWNQTRFTWDWQQIGGTPTNKQDAEEFAYGFAQTYNVPTKVVSRAGVTMYLPPNMEAEQALQWPVIDATMIQTEPPRRVQ